ncbi:MAG: dipeptide ABC transporter ATP-binding protein [Alphaproteobacteria bacterium]
MQDAPLIEVSGLRVGFAGRSGRVLEVLRGVDLAVRRGETVGIVGESGSGKSTLLLAAMGHFKRGLRATAGSVRFSGIDLLAQPRQELERIRGRRLALIPQNSGQSLTPNLRIEAQVAEVLALHGTRPAAEHPARVRELLAQVRLPDPDAIARRYPHELSGGQQQRVAIAMALAGEPEALLLDEPTTGLDVTTQAHVLDLLSELAARLGTAMVYVSHDLGAIARVCARVAVMYGGEIVLDGDARRVLVDPAHPYARGLLASIPRLAGGALPASLEGRPPEPGGAGPGCAFADRCALAIEACRTTHPELAPLPDGTRARCLRPEAVAGLSLRGPDAPAREAVDASRPRALALDALAVSYARQGLLDQLLGRQPAGPRTVDAIDLVLREGEAVALVGESGSGKSTILKAIAGLVPRAGGTIALADAEALAPDVASRAPGQLRAVQLVFQNPDESLNPRHDVATILAQPLGLYFGLSGDALRQRSVELLEQVRLGAHYLDRLPGQLSGGEKQRIAIARAFAAGPRVVLCDEVTSALDVSVQAAVLALLDDLRRVGGTTFVFVSHDLAVVRAVAARGAVLYQGRICEIGPVSAVYSSPSHPYTEALMAAVLEPEPGARPRLLADDVQESAPPARGCPFQRRCHRRIGEACMTQAPPAREAGDGHVIRCHIPIEDLRAAQVADARANGRG